MKCKKCNSENPDNALFCRVCGEKLIENSKGSSYGFFNALFWVGLVISLYCLVSVAFPIESYHKFYDGTQHLYYNDPFGINSHGKSYYLQEWMSALIVSSVITAILFWLRKKQKK